MSLQRFKLPQNDQASSPFFTNLPGEIRDKIYTLVFEQYEDHNKPYPKDALYRRPGFEAPLRIDCALLQTCQKAYRESWNLPMENAEHVFWLHQSLRSTHILPPGGLRRSVASLNAIQSFTATHAGMKLGQMTIFPAVYALSQESFFEAIYRETDPSRKHQLVLRNILDISHFSPATITITIRHCDWDGVMLDAPLVMHGDFVNRCRLPNSIKDFRIDLETVSRKQMQVDYVAEEITQNWHFQQKDESIMSANKRDWKVKTWSGTSIIDDVRFMGDEVDDKPGWRKYCIRTVVWKLNPALSISTRLEAQNVMVPRDFQAKISEDDLWCETDTLEAAGVKASTPASQAKIMLSDYKAVLSLYPGVYDGYWDDNDAIYD